MSIGARVRAAGVLETGRDKTRTIGMLAQELSAAMTTGALPSSRALPLDRRLAVLRVLTNGCVHLPRLFVFAHPAPPFPRAQAVFADMLATSQEPRKAWKAHVSDWLSTAPSTAVLSRISSKPSEAIAALKGMLDATQPGSSISTAQALAPVATLLQLVK